MSTLLNAIAIVLAFLIGMFPTGLLIAHFKGGRDITAEGSGNVGATNVARVLGVKAGILTLLGDALKGALAVFISLYLADTYTTVSICAIMVVYGHCYPIPAKVHGKQLKGGKGVATGLGAMFALTPITAVTAILIFALVLKFSHIVSVASLSAALTAPIVAMLINESGDTAGGLCCMAIIIAIRHRENIQRLMAGEEKKFNLPF